MLSTIGEINHMTPGQYENLDGKAYHCNVRVPSNSARSWHVRPDPVLYIWGSGNTTNEAILSLYRNVRKSLWEYVMSVENVSSQPSKQ